jgi:asparagine synthase (glutamine-hydrolysing)
MVSACGRFVIVFNGEIYNHLELRKDLEKSGHLPTGVWRGHSDTETLLAGFTVWGIEKTLQSTVGMFALALWDKYESKLTLTRDRIGEKPLYYGWQSDAFLFGSELKSLRAHPSFKGEMDWNAASSYLRWNYIPAPSSIYQGIYKLVPGTFLQLTPTHIQKKTLPSPMTYWSLADSAWRGINNPYAGSFADAVDELESLVREAVQLQSVADVAVGAFLSGGIDSSTVVAMMQSATSSKITTFSIGMPDARMDESQHAAAVARHLGTNHVEHIIQPHEALDLIPQLPEIWDEPFADSSQIPTYLVSRLARQHVTVSLSGDGGDEFFLGYPQYALYQKLWQTRRLGKLPWGAALSLLAPLSGNQTVNHFLMRSKAIVGAWRQSDAQALNRYWSDRYRGGAVPILNQYCTAMLEYPLLPDPADTAGLWDAGTYLPDDILVKVDRAAMANGLETRAPLLDHRIIEFAYRLPSEYKLKNQLGKKVLREVLYRHVPRHLVDRPKMGFSIPLSSWLKNELKPWAKNMLFDGDIDLLSFNKVMVNRIWTEHMLGHHDHTEKLWGVLCLAAFVKKNHLN